MVSTTRRLPDAPHHGVAASGGALLCLLEELQDAIGVVRSVARREDPIAQSVGVCLREFISPRVLSSSACPKTDGVR
jgi:hypothetical protein